ncbi:MAG: hypothetical protein WCK90_01525, partial [archaeon]
MGWMFDYDGTPTLGGAGVLAVAALAVILGGCGISNNWKYSEGDKVGMVNTISRKGTFAVTKTYEGQMALEGISGSGNSLGANIWHFSIDNYLPMKKQEELAERVSEFMNSGQKARVHYVQMFKTWPTRSGSS